MPTHTNICNLWWFLHLSNLIDFIRHLECFLSSDLVTVQGPSQKWHQYLNKTFLSFSRPIDYLRPWGSSDVHSRCSLHLRRSGLSNNFSRGCLTPWIYNISVFDKKGINAQCRRCLLCSGRHVLMSEQCSERILLGHHHIQEIQKTVTHHTWIWLQPSIPPT